MFEKELELLLKKNWTGEEIEMINKLLETLQYYRKIIPKSLKQEITVALQMCNTLKTELDTFREKCKCIHKELQDSNIQDSNIQESNIQESNIQDSNIQESNIQDSNIQESNIQDPDIK